MTETFQSGSHADIGIALTAAVLFMVSFAGLAYVLLKAMLSGAQVYSGAYSENVARQFEDVFLFIPARRITEAGWTMAATLFILVFMFTGGDFGSLTAAMVGLILAGAAGLAGLYTPRLLLACLKRRRLRRFNLQLVDTIIAMSNALKAGFSITQAFETVVKDGENPIAQEFDLFLQQTRMGVAFSDALRNLDERVESDDMTLVALSIETARKTGGNLTEIFEKISAMIRERMRIEGRIRTLTAQGRLQGFILGSMPVAIAVVLIFLDRKTMIPFFQSHMGIGICVAVVLLVALGALVIRKIVKIDV
ncbi:MAG: type II secretion system F family protein [Verrucomicrobiota bacterium]|nr:type II secretion system F family protein [Verrucomicrobiota bacterium]